jgi:hypothetical protein
MAAPIRPRPPLGLESPAQRLDAFEPHIKSGALNTMAKKSSHSSSNSRIGSKGKRKIHKVMKEQKEGKLKSSSGKKVKSRKQAVAIALSEARRSGAKIPRKKSS